LEKNKQNIKKLNLNYLSLNLSVKKKDELLQKIIKQKVKKNVK